VLTGAGKPVLPPHLRKPLKAREYQVDTDAKIGKAQVVVPGTATSNQAGFYCDVCDCIVKDSANYLDHINGKKRTRSLTHTHARTHGCVSAER
jgi:U4/U6.U5 tri-snRNP component SNU23